MELEWTIVDGIGPFFRCAPEGTINWSKIPFEALDSAWEERPQELWEQIEADFATLCSKSSRMGFNVITLDDLAHLALHDFYGEELKEKIVRYREAYRRLFRIAQDHGLQVWITSDIVFMNPAIRRSVGSSRAAMERFFRESCEQLLRDFEEVKGLVLRFGESDGLDVAGDFTSELFIKTSVHLRRFVRSLLPIFEQRDATLVLRTWTVGVYPIGDIIWNPRTLNRALKGIESDHLVLSMKYGESDFFRYLPLNDAFWTTPLNKIIELQCRREYEGAGRFPSFIGYEYEIYRNELENNPEIKGIMIWIQTGGWTRCRRLTFLEPSGIWNELNARVTVALFHSSRSCDEILTQLGKKVLPGMNNETVQQLCRTSHHSVRRLFYVRDFALKRLFFRRVRIPPLMGITWDTVWVHPLLGRIFGFFIEDRHRLIRETWEAVSDLEDLIEALEEGPAKEDVKALQHLAVAIGLGREHILGLGDEKGMLRLKSWKGREGDGYDIRLFDSNLPHSFDLQKWFSLLVRQDANYRWFDQIVTLRLVGWCFPLVYFFKKKHIPRELRDQAMGIESLFK